MQERREETGEWVRKDGSGVVSMKIAAASTAIMNETQTVGEGRNVTLCGTR